MKKILKMHKRFLFQVFIVSLFVFLFTHFVYADTIIMDASSCTRMAGISEAAPRQSWALCEPISGFFSNGEASIAQGRSLLICFPLDKIPKGSRIIHAELVIPVIWGYGNEPRFYIWRMLADWGPGVCHLFRKTLPEPVKWTKPHAAGISSDRATRPTDIVRVSVTENKTVNVTEDVELWYTGAAPNNGWLISIEDPGIYIRLYSPIYAYPAMWKLKVTFEPEAAK